MKLEPTNVRLAESTLAKIKLASDISGEKSAEIMRLAMELGLRRLEAVGYDIQRMTMNGIEAAEAAATAPISSLPAAPQAKKLRSK